MDDFIEQILDQLFGIFGWALPILGKFWFIIAGYLGYKLFGKAGKKMTQGMPQRTLTPVENGGFPKPTEPQKRKAVRASSKYEPIQPVSMEGIGVEQEWAFVEPNHTDTDHSMHLRDRAQSSDRQEQQKDSLGNLDPREGMKWAIIFGEPRSKAPFAPPSARKRTP